MAEAVVKKTDLGRLLNATRDMISTMSIDDIQSLIHELQVHQVELEMQNDELRNTQLELSILRDRYMDLFDLSPIGYLTLDHDARIINSNIAAAELLGLHCTELTRRPFIEFLIPKDRELFSKYFNEVMGSRTLKKAEMHIARANGGKSTVRLESICDIADDSTDEPFCVRTGIVDITERVEAEEQIRSNEQKLRGLNEELQQRNLRKDEFLAMLAHELRNPLSAISSAARLFKTEDKLKQERAHEVIERQIKHLAHLIDDLLDVSRITRGKIQLHSECVDMREVIQSAMDTVISTDAACSKHLNFHPPTESLPVYGDRTRLEQILSNLISNACKYTPDEGRIDISARRAGSEVEISVIDNGIGISKEMLPLIFDMFVQVKPTLDRASGGLGLGLTLVDRLVKLHEGSISAQSEGLGRGATFVVRLPLSVDSATVERPEGHSVARNEKSHKILIVEDNLDSGQMLRMLLEFDGYEVRLAQDGISALKTAQEFLPEAILLDIGLPEMDGYQVAQRLRKNPALDKTSIIGLSGYGMPEDRMRSASAGFNYHLLKPVNYDELQHVFSEIFAHSDKEKTGMEDDALQFLHQ